ncbi:hypothetical protein M408DRAFT_72484 [Serendipita vermifera MAFF 305830]|uniref:Macro domain-containing protein n=1 Tax=Serendipita vermifera MAFF 305830 TaxID=933852 RepID=A0A0C3APQ5_SERVB|nr:hypothetical protein M408DRAFT_72484 [Serendipita vermifera MAFF 305830]
MRGIALATIPTLRYLYKNKTLKQAAKEAQRFSYRAELLDRVSLFQGDITKLEVDAIVNAANRSLLGGGGVDGAIHNAAGRGLLRECSSLGGADTGQAKITGGYDLPAKHVIHAVGPVYSGSHKDIKAAQLSACYSNSLSLALENKLKSIAFCSISTGIYGYPIVDATEVALETTRTFLDQNESAKDIDRVIFVVWSDKDKHVYEHLLPQFFPQETTETESKAEKAPQEAEPPEKSKPEQPTDAKPTE